MNSFEQRMGVDDGYYRDQLHQVKNGNLGWIILSGKMASGKDTLAPLLKLPGKTTHILSYGEVLRRELLKVVPIVNRHLETNSKLFYTVEASRAIQLVAESLGYKYENAYHLFRMITPYIQANGGLDPWHRSEFHREVLQMMGSDWLPDDDYLPRTSSKQAIPLVAGGDSVIVTGGRFLPDVELPRSGGAIVVRVKVDRETQLERLRLRDGLEPTEELLAQLSHPGEIALDDYVPHIGIDNGNGQSAVQVATQLQEMIDLEFAKRQFASSASL